MREILNKVLSFDLRSLAQARALLKSHHNAVKSFFKEIPYSQKSEGEREILQYLSLAQAPLIELPELLQNILVLVNRKTTEINAARQSKGLNTLFGPELADPLCDMLANELPDNQQQLQELYDKLWYLESIAYYTNIIDERANAITFLFGAVADKLRRLSKVEAQVSESKIVPTEFPPDIKQFNADAFEEAILLFPTTMKLNRACEKYKNRQIQNICRLKQVDEKGAQQLIQRVHSTNLADAHNNLYDPKLRKIVRKYDDVEEIRATLDDKNVTSLSGRVENFEKKFVAKAPQLEKHRDTTFFVSHVRKILNWFASWFGKKVVPTEGRKLIDNEFAPLITKVKNEGFLPVKRKFPAVIQNFNEPDKTLTNAAPR